MRRRILAVVAVLLALTHVVAAAGVCGEHAVSGVSCCPMPSAAGGDHDCERDASARGACCCDEDPGGGDRAPARALTPRGDLVVTEVVVDEGRAAAFPWGRVSMPAEPERGPPVPATTLVAQSILLLC